MLNYDPAIYSILVVDDEHLVRRTLVRVLQATGYQTVDTADPTEAVSLLEAEPFDVIISDYMMPKMDGLELLRRAKLLRPDSVRIMLTGRADLDVAIQAINQGEIYRFMTKPWDAQELRVNLKIACEQLTLKRDNEKLAREVRHRDKVIEQIERDHPGISSIRRNSKGAIIIDDIDL